MNSAAPRALRRARAGVLRLAVCDEAEFRIVSVRGALWATSPQCGQPRRRQPRLGGIPASLAHLIVVLNQVAAGKPVDAAGSPELPRRRGSRLARTRGSPARDRGSGRAWHLARLPNPKWCEARRYPSGTRTSVVRFGWRGTRAGHACGGCCPLPIAIREVYRFAVGRLFTEFAERRHSFSSSGRTLSRRSTRWPAQPPPARSSSAATGGQDSSQRGRQFGLAGDSILRRGDRRLPPSSAGRKNPPAVRSILFVVSKYHRKNAAMATECACRRSIRAFTTAHTAPGRRPTSSLQVPRICQVVTAPVGVGDDERGGTRPSAGAPCPLDVVGRARRHVAQHHCLEFADVDAKLEGR